MKGYKVYGVKGETVHDLVTGLTKVLSAMRRGGWRFLYEPIRVSDGLVILCVHNDTMAADSRDKVIGILRGMMPTAIKEDVPPNVSTATLSFITMVFSSIPEGDLQSALQSAEKLIHKIAPKLDHQKLNTLVSELKIVREHHKKTCDDDKCGHAEMLEQIQKSLEEELTKSVC